MGRWGTAYSVARHRDWPLAERGAHRVRSHRFWFAGTSIPSVSILSVSLDISHDLDRPDHPGAADGSTRPRLRPQEAAGATDRRYVRTQRQAPVSGLTPLR